MFLKNQTRILSVSLLVFFISPSCAIITSPTQLPTSPAATKTLQTEFGLTAASMETERPLVTFQDFQPRADISGVILAGLGRKTKINT